MLAFKKGLKSVAAVVVVVVGLTIMVGFGAEPLAAAEAQTLDGLIKENNISITINGQHIPRNDRPFIDETGRIQVPLRVVAEKMNCTVDWDQATKMATITDGVKNVVYQFPLNEPYYLAGTDKKVMDTTAMTKNNRIYLPVRYVGELFGEVKWHQEEYWVEIITDGAYLPSWRQDKALQAKLAEGKVVKLADVMTGVLEGANPAKIETLQAWEKSGELTIKSYDTDPFGVYYTTLKEYKDKPFIISPITGENLSVYWIKDKQYFDAGLPINDGIIAYEPKYEQAVVGYDHLAFWVSNPMGDTVTLYVIPAITAPDEVITASEK